MEATRCAVKVVAELILTNSVNRAFDIGILDPMEPRRRGY
jgi:hypothetical protein